MKKTDGRKRTGRNIALLILLALLCVGGVELAACSYFAPETYQRITAPARWVVTAALDACGRGLDSARQFFLDTADHAVQFWTELITPKETPTLEEPPNQFAEEPDFVPNWPAVDPTITELKEVDGQQILTGGNVNIVYFCQSDETWGNQPYGTDTIGPYGCGPTAMAMVVASLTDTETDPAVMAAWAVSHGYWAKGGGSYHSIVPGTAEAFGLEVESVQDWTVDALYESLNSGKVIVALMGPGHFTKLGHFIVLRGVTLSGGILVADPNSPERSLTVWDPQIILDEIAIRARNGGPLWALSLPTPTVEGLE